MQIREQGQQVQLIRSPYDSAKKRCVQKVVHTFKRMYPYSSGDLSTYLSAEQLLDLSDGEKRHLSDWLKGKADKSAADGRARSINLADKHIGFLADNISSDGVSPEKAAVIWEAIEKLSKSLKKAGHPRSASRPPAAPPVVPVPAGQASLSLEPSFPLQPGE